MVSPELNPKEERFLALARAQESATGDPTLRACWEVVTAAIAERWILTSHTGELSVQGLMDALKRGDTVAVGGYGMSVEDGSTVRAVLGDAVHRCPRGPLLRELWRLSHRWLNDVKLLAGLTVPPRSGRLSVLAFTEKAYDREFRRRLRQLKDGKTLSAAVETRRGHIRISQLAWLDYPPTGGTRVQVERYDADLMDWDAEPLEKFERLFDDIEPALEWLEELGVPWSRLRVPQPPNMG